MYLPPAPPFLVFPAPFLDCEDLHHHKGSESAVQPLLQTCSRVVRVQGCNPEKHRRKQQASLKLQPMVLQLLEHFAGLKLEEHFVGI